MSPMQPPLTSPALPGKGDESGKLPDLNVPDRLCSPQLCRKTAKNNKQRVNRGKHPLAFSSSFPLPRPLPGAAADQLTRG